MRCLIVWRCAPIGSACAQRFALPICKTLENLKLFCGGKSMRTNQATTPDIKALQHSETPHQRAGFPRGVVGLMRIRFLHVIDVFYSLLQNFFASRTATRHQPKHYSPDVSFMFARAATLWFWTSRFFFSSSIESCRYTCKPDWFGQSSFSQ